MGIVERWNSLARKKIYINDSLEIGVGRLVYSGILFSVSVIWGMLNGATAVQLIPSLMFWIRSFKKPEENECD